MATPQFAIATDITLGGLIDNLARNRDKLRKLTKQVEQLKTEKLVVETSIDSQGRYFVNQRKVRDNRVVTLKRAIRSIVGDKPNPQLIISSDKSTPYESVIRAMDAARQLGLTHINLATKKAEGQ